MHTIDSCPCFMQTGHPCPLVLAKCHDEMRRAENVDTRVGTGVSIVCVRLSSPRAPAAAPPRAGAHPPARRRSREPRRSECKSSHHLGRCTNRHSRALGERPCGVPRATSDLTTMFCLRVGALIAGAAGRAKVRGGPQQGPSASEGLLAARNEQVAKRPSTDAQGVASRKRASA
jgi:hypothetical protein